MKESGDSLTLHLAADGRYSRRSVAQNKGDKFVVGFAAETSDVAPNARKKLAGKKSRPYRGQRCHRRRRRLRSRHQRCFAIFCATGATSTLSKIEQIRSGPAHPRRNCAAAKHAAHQTGHPPFGGLTPTMPDRLPEELQQKLSSRLRFYRRYRHQPIFSPSRRTVGFASENSDQSVAPASPRRRHSGCPFCESQNSPCRRTAECLGERFIARELLPILLRLFAGTSAKTALAANCMLAATRLVFGDGSPTARLTFHRRRPRARRRSAGLPFIGRAGKLLTQMIEAMGLQRGDVYICNVVKCRPPENRAPENDEVEACSPFLLRQIDLVNPASDCLPGLHRRPHDPQYHAWEFPVSRPVARISWAEN